MSDPKTERQPNRLIHEASAYLRQHAHNPVDWYPWGEEALARAKQEDKPILLSIGYSACHWCHVMERESFEDASTALVMNTHFVNIKVDREERPDLDQIYQTVVQLLRQSGGWPLTVFLTPDQRPFYAGTYFPPVPRYGMPGFRELLVAIRQAYDDKREDVGLQAEEITRAVADVTSAGRRASAGAGAELGPDLLSRAAQKLGRRFDDEHGGFGQRPKFPNTMNLDVLLRHASHNRDATAEARVRRALDAMRAGGIWDHLGYGFHRYSTDEKWLVPHFEKMLYDNAQLLRLYTDAARALGEARYLSVAREIGDYLLREMQSPGGAFYASQDADSEGEEGKFFVWRPGEIEAVIADETTRKVVSLHYGVTAEGNFEHSGATVLAEAMSLDRIALRLSLAPSEVARRLDEGRAALFAAREGRPRPFRDEKLLACWNGLAIGALAELGAASGEARWVEAAERAFAQLEARLIDEHGGVARYLAVEGEKERVLRPGFLDDHANLANAALDLYEATAEPRYALVARTIADRILDRFWEGDGFTFTASGGEALIVRTRDPYDQATPSGPSMAALLCLRLGSLVGEPYAGRAAQFLERTAPSALDNPFGFGQALCAIDRLVRGSIDVLIVGARGDIGAEALRRAALGAYVPNRTLALAHDEASRAAAAALAEGKPGREGVAVAYVCRGRSCSAPVATPEELRTLLLEAP